MAEQQRPSGAVFLSYASEDAYAAARICESLRAAGIEVWLDKDELRGGDAWDSKIKRQIHECALFVPLISAHTNARSEGYFRREWKQAIRRLEDIADDTAFLVPVVIDDTREVHARVPEEFRGVHWTRIPGGEATPAITERVIELLSRNPIADSAVSSAATETGKPSVRIVTPSRRNLPPHLRWIGGVLVALLALGGGYFWYYQRVGEVPAATTPESAEQAVPAIATDENSIAVLAFVNMSPDKDQEYFADGIAEEILNLLAQVPDLKVIARTSSFAFKGEKIEVAEIAKRLKVAHVVEGSVRKSGNMLRITAQLVRAADSVHLWSETYDRPLDDIFAVQDDIAGEVVKALKLTLLATARTARSKPQDLEAYNLALQGRFFLERRGQKDLERAVKFFLHARDRDQNYAPAWAGLSQAYARQAANGDVPAADGYRRARETAERALSLDPQLAEAHLAMGMIHSDYDLDWAAAGASIRQALELEPGSAVAIRRASIQAANLGRWSEAIDLSNKAVERDPLRPNSYNNLGWNLLAVDRDMEAEAGYRKALELDPGGASRHFGVGLSLLLQGKKDTALHEMQQETDEFWRLLGLALAFQALGRRDESDAALATVKEKYAESSAFQIAEVHAYRHEADLAFEWLERAYGQRDSGLQSIKGDRFLRELASDPRYKAFLKKLKLPV